MDFSLTHKTIPNRIVSNSFVFSLGLVCLGKSGGIRESKIYDSKGGPKSFCFLDEKLKKNKTKKQKTLGGGGRKTKKKILQIKHTNTPTHIFSFFEINFFFLILHNYSSVSSFSDKESHTILIFEPTIQINPKRGKRRQKGRVETENFNK